MANLLDTVLAYLGLTLPEEDGSGGCTCNPCTCGSSCLCE